VRAFRLTSIAWASPDLDWRACAAAAHLLGATRARLSITMFADPVLVRARKLAGAWIELMTARQAAEQRERAADAPIVQMQSSPP